MILDPFFIRQNNDSDEIDIYYHINNGELTVADVKINIYEEDNLDQSSNEPVLYQSLPGVKNLDGSFAGGEQIHFNWDPKDKDQTSNDLPELGFYRFELEVTLQDSKGSQTLLKTDIEDGDPEMPGWQQPERGFAVHDLIWKHRPVVHVSANETIGPPQYPFNDALRPFYRHRNDLASQPDYAEPSLDSSELPEFESFESLTSLASRASHEDFLLQSEFTTHPYLDIQDEITDSPLTVQSELMYITPLQDDGVTLINPNYVFMQYWMYQPGSKSPVVGLLGAGAQFLVHEGDWEMVQLTIRLQDSKDANAKYKWIEPFAATASQHYYGQTIGWRRNKKPSDQFEHLIDQNWVDHIENGNRVKIYNAQDSHATYFRKGLLNSEEAGCGGANDDFIYKAVSSAGAWDEVENQSEISYTLLPLNGSMINEWKGRWGQYYHYDIESFLSFFRLGFSPPSPLLRINRGPDEDSPKISMQQNPHTFHSRCMKDSLATELILQ